MTAESTGAGVESHADGVGTRPGDKEFTQEDTNRRVDIVPNDTDHQPDGRILDRTTLTMLEKIL